MSNSHIHREHFPWNCPQVNAIRPHWLLLETLVQVMAWFCQAATHCLSQCWPRFKSSYMVTRPQWVCLQVQLLAGYNEISSWDCFKRSYDKMLYQIDVLFWVFFFSCCLKMVPVYCMVHISPGGFHDSGNHALKEISKPNYQMIHL